MYEGAGQAEFLFHASGEFPGGSFPELSKEALETSLALWEQASTTEGLTAQKVIALSELILATDDPAFKDALVELEDEIIPLYSFGEQFL